jgi:hypothetical protein
MTTSSAPPSTGDLVDGTLGLAAGLGILTMALFPLAIPLLALTAAALIPLLLISLAAGLIAAPFLLLRRLFRQALLVRREGRWQTPSCPRSSHSALRGRPGRAARCDV